MDVFSSAFFWSVPKGFFFFSFGGAKCEVSMNQLHSKIHSRAHNYGMHMTTLISNTIFCQKEEMKFFTREK